MQTRLLCWSTAFLNLTWKICVLEFLFQPQVPRNSASLCLLKYPNQILCWLGVDKVHSVYSHSKDSLSVELVSMAAMGKLENIPKWTACRLALYLILFLSLLVTFPAGMNTHCDPRYISLGLVMTFPEQMCIPLEKYHCFLVKPTLMQRWESDHGPENRVQRLPSQFPGSGGFRAEDQDLFGLQADCSRTLSVLP